MLEIVKMEDGLLLLIAKIAKKVIEIPGNCFDIYTVNGHQYFSYFTTFNDRPIKYIMHGGDRSWSSMCKLNAENLTYLLNALNAQEDKNVKSI